MNITQAVVSLLVHTRICNNAAVSLITFTFERLTQVQMTLSEYKRSGSVYNSCNKGERSKVIKKMIEKNKNGEPYTFYEGPPTANGKPH